MELIGRANLRCKTEFGLVELKWSEKRVYMSLKCRGLYRSLLEDFLLAWFKGWIQVGFKVLVGRIPFFRDQILDFRNFVGDSHVRLASPATQILSYAVYWCSVITRRVL